MRVTLLALLLLAVPTFSSVILSSFIRTWTGELAKRRSGGNCRSVKIKEGICPREAEPQGVTLDPSHQPVTECFRDMICCGDGCNGLNIVGPAGKRAVVPEQVGSTIMEEPNMKPLVKRQDIAPQAVQQVTIYQNGQLLDQKYAGRFGCKLPVAAPRPSPPSPPPPAPSAVRETVFHIGYFQSKKTGLPQGADVTQFKAAVFADNGADIDERIACHDPPTYRDEDFTIGERPKYPEKIRFDSAGRKGCEFDRLGNNEAGA
ncbi:MAG: hypothetical protein Q9226_001944 [Calogaya cf. arnoldii]